MKSYDVTIRVTIDDDWRSDAEEEMGMHHLTTYIRRELHRRVAMHPRERVELVGWEPVSSIAQRAAGVAKKLARMS